MLYSRSLDLTVDATASCVHSCELNIAVCDTQWTHSGHWAVRFMAAIAAHYARSLHSDHEIGLCPDISPHSVSVQ